MARTRNDWQKSSSGAIWLPEPSRRTLITGVGAGAAAFLLGCEASEKGNGGPAGGTPGAGGTAGAGGSPVGAGGTPAGGGTTAPGAGGSGPVAGTGGTPAAGGTSAEGGAPGTGGSAGGPDGGAPMTMDTGAAPSPADPNEVPSPAAQPTKCTARSEQTAGPFPASSVQLNRSDIRSDPADRDLVKPGIPLRVVFRVGQGTGAACKPMAGATINVWQCDAQGKYSGYGSEGTGGKKFLRGFQMTDNSGVAEFITIYPGAYPSRSLHIHFSVRMSPQVSFPNGGFVSQIYFDDNVNAEVLAQAPYNTRTFRKNTQDGIFESIMLTKPVKSGKGYLVEFDIGV